MQYTTLGDSGLEVSRIGLGCFSFGLDNSDVHEWTLGEESSRAMIEAAIDHGINFFDTGNVYSLGDSERVLGRTLEDYDRDWSVVATKVCSDMDPTNPNASGLSRKAIEQELENSLDRLGLDTIDLYQMHRWDDSTPIEETLSTFDDAVRRGKVRYVGASSMWAYQFATAVHVAKREGFEPLVTMQNHYNLAYREEEREMLPLCEQEGIGVLPWSPFARGYLARPHVDIDSTTRGKSDERVYTLSYREGGGIEINERVEEIAEHEGISMAQVAFAWLLHKDWVDAPIIGVTSLDHLEEAVEAVDVSLSDGDLEYLEEPYEPVPVGW